METKVKRDPYVKIPCRDCLTLPCCVSILQEEIKTWSYIYIFELCNRCSLARDYLHPFVDPSDHKSKLMKISKNPPVYIVIAKLENTKHSYRARRLRKFFRGKGVIPTL
jgi:hypothetical protein